MCSAVAQQGLGSWRRWPGWLLYAPAVPRFVSLCLRHRLGPLALLKANPAWRYGGSVFESKFARYQPFADRTGIVPTVLVRARDARDAGSLSRRLLEADIDFPVVAKPDLGHHSRGVMKVSDLGHLGVHLARCRYDCLLQPYIPLPCEFSAYYYRLPGEARGMLLELTERILPAATGACSRASESRAEDHPREAGQAALTTDVNAGTALVDRREWRHEALVRRLDELVAGVPFFVGAFDFKSPTHASLETGRDLHVFEINGVTAALSAIRDPACTYREALAAIFQQLEVIFQVASQNRGCPSPGLRGALQQLVAVWQAYHGAR
jgi:hypothetical protein